MQDPPAAWVNDDASIVDNTILISVRAWYLGHKSIRQRVETNRARQVSPRIGVEARLMHGIKVLAAGVLVQNGPVLRGKAQGPVCGAVVRWRPMYVLGRNAPGQAQREQSGSRCQEFRFQRLHANSQSMCLLSSASQALRTERYISSGSMIPRRRIVAMITVARLIVGRCSVGIDPGTVVVNMGSDS